MAYEIPIQSFSLPSTAAIIQFRVVALTSGGGVKHTTGVSTGLAAIRPIGVAQERSTGSGRMIQIMHQGVTKCAVSTGAVKIGQYLRQTSGAASTASNLGGTVKASTNQSAYYSIGQALTSAAAAAAGTQRFVAMRLL